MDVDKTNKIVALGIVIGMALAALYLPVYPCTYTDAIDGREAGYGYHSLMDMILNGMEWRSTELPNRFWGYGGIGPYMVEPAAWITLLYIPIFVGIGLFSIDVSKKGLRCWFPSKA